MTVKMSVSLDGKIKISTGPDNVRLEDLGKWLRRNDDAVLVKLNGPHEVFDKLKPGHLTRIEKDEDGQHYNVLCIAEGKVPYGARHTFSNKLKNAEGDDVDKAALMGHSKYTFTQTNYQSTNEDELLAVMDSIK